MSLERAKAISLSCCSKQFLARKNLATPHFPLPLLLLFAFPSSTCFSSLNFFFLSTFLNSEQIVKSSRIVVRKARNVDRFRTIDSSFTFFSSSFPLVPKLRPPWQKESRFLLLMLTLRFACLLAVFIAFRVVVFSVRSIDIIGRARWIFISRMASTSRRRECLLSYALRTQCFRRKLFKKSVFSILQGIELSAATTSNTSRE